MSYLGAGRDRCYRCTVHTHPSRLSGVHMQDTTSEGKENVAGVMSTLAMHSELDTRFQMCELEDTWMGCVRWLESQFYVCFGSLIMCAINNMQIPRYSRSILIIENICDGDVHGYEGTYLDSRLSFN